jgi:urease gamma subunit
MVDNLNQKFPTLRKGGTSNTVEAIAYIAAYMIAGSRDHKILKRLSSKSYITLAPLASAISAHSDIN